MTLDKQPTVNNPEEDNALPMILEGTASEIVEQFFMSLVKNLAPTKSIHLVTASSEISNSESKDPLVGNL
jgi:hypothetical protein